MNVKSINWLAMIYAFTIMVIVFLAFAILILLFPDAASMVIHKVILWQLS